MKQSVIFLLCATRSKKFGQNSYMESIIPFLKKNQNYDVTFIYTDDKDIVEVKNLIIDGFNVLSVPNLRNMTLLTGENNYFQRNYAQWIISKIYPFLRNHSNPIFWANSIDFLNVCIELKLVFKICKIIYVHHSFSWKYLMNVEDSIFTKKWKDGNDYDIHPRAFEMTRYQQKMGLISDLLVTVTNHAKEFFINTLNIPENKIKTIYNGISISKFKQKSRSYLRNKYGFSAKDQIIIFSGRITKDKGYIHLLKAFKLIADRNENIKLVIMGNGYPLDQISAVKPHWNKVIYTGELLPEEINEFYQLSNVGVIPSLHEQCSFTAIEMRFNKLPLIVSGVDGLDELFSHEFDSLKLSVRINNSGERVLDKFEFADKIQKLLDNEKLSRKLINNSYIVANKRFSDTITWKKYDELLNSLCIMVSKDIK